MMLYFVLSSTHLSMRMVCRRLAHLSLKEFKGENIQTEVSVVRGAVSMLSHNEALPSDFLEIISEIMKTSSTDNFNTFVTTMETNHTESVKNLTIEDLLLPVQDKYSKTTVNNKWYIGTTDENQQSIFACINCGNPSHYENDCINDFVEGPHNRRDRSSFKGNRGKFGQERGRGRFGRSCGREINIFRAPPVQKISYSRSRNQDLEH